MKRTSFLILLTLLIFSTRYLPISSAQDYTQWALPEGAKARIGKGRVSDMQYSPDGTILAVAGSVGIWLYDAETLQELALLSGGKYSPRNISFSPDSTTLISENSDDVMVWDVAARAHKRTFENMGSPVLLSPNGLLLASENYKGIHLWDAKTGKRKKTIAARLHYRSSMLFRVPMGKPLQVCIRVDQFHYGIRILENSRKNSQDIRKTFIVCRSAPMGKRSRVVEIGLSACGIQRLENLRKRSQDIRKPSTAWRSARMVKHSQLEVETKLSVYGT